MTRISRGAPPFGARSKSPSFRPRTGRPGPPLEGQFRRVRSRRIEAEMARGARAGALDPFLHRLRPRATARFLRPLPEGRSIMAGAKRPPVMLQRCASWGEIFTPLGSSKEWPLARTRWTRFCLNPQSSRSWSGGALPSRRKESSSEAMGDGVTFLRLRR